MVDAHTFGNTAGLAGALHQGRSTTTRELDSRTSDGIDVRLLWHPVDGHVSVVVNDTKTGEGFELAIRRGQRALDVFHHPYAYAASAVRPAR